MVVAWDLGRCLVTKSAVNPGQEAKLPALMSLTKVETTGLKQAACRYETKSCFVWVANALLAA